MADPVKISELPSISSVQPNDIIPIVDSALTQTSKCTASQIAAIGGGPPADGSVTTAKIASGAVTYPKIQNVTGDRVLGKTSGASGTVEEIPCTSFARTLLAAADGNAARSLLNDTPTFNGTVTVNGSISVVGGQVRTPDGTASLPSYSFSDDTNTGIARLGGPNTLSLVTDGVERFRANANGSFSAWPTVQVNNVPTLLPAFMCRAFVKFDGFSKAVLSSGNISSVIDAGQGAYGVNFATPMPDANYCFTTGSRDSSSGPAGTQAFVNVNYAFNITASTLYLYSARRTDGLWLDIPEVCVAIFR